jgi:hypothetical protein
MFIRNIGAALTLATVTLIYALGDNPLRALTLGHDPVTQGQEPNAQATSNSSPSAATATAVVLRFAVQGAENHDVSALSAKACPPVPVQTADAQASTPAKPINVDPAILDDISQKMKERLSKKMTVLVDPAESDIPTGAMVISGCITRANPGNAEARLVGMEVGASHLSVHITALHKANEGFQPFDDFTIDVKGGDLLPPIGPIGVAVHAARDREQTLSADASKIANKILKKIASDEKAHRQMTAVN